MQKPNSLISIIIPIYKVEPYLRRCLNSIVNQTYTNLEIILVDDGSPDSCPQICDEYAVKDNRIIVIHKRNGGLSDARNAGLNICKGEYISFVDSDDWVDEKYIEILLELAIKENADIAIGENIQTNDICNKPNNISKIQIYSSKEALYHLFSQDHIAFTISCGKLYRKELFSNLHFPIGKYHEDEYTTYILFYHSKKIVYTNCILYYYFRHSNSITGSRHPWDVLEVFEQRYLFFKDKNEKDLLPLLIVPLCWQLLCAYWFESNKTPIKAKKHLSDFQKYTQEESFSQVPLFHKFFLKIFSKFPFLYILCRKLPFHIRKEF
ncbi:glycosyltransferase family 2 protein [Fibrobacter sp.]|uniref:glycosyltransferase family 2 protein n=1 Tax=Fibrobacter sp. TaxID=35828 RepID=UPI0025C4658A|nr:glycosyltransferase family 2 protein [Fibrobacter sp.]MBR3071813.1 glycosyltransferase family 2 protein [Fibrobacter sp.]